MSTPDQRTDLSPETDPLNSGGVVTSHLVMQVSDRGFAHLPPIESDYGGSIRVYESSAAEQDCLWMRMECPVDLNRPDGPMKETVWHGPIEDAVKFAEQITLLALVRRSDG